MNQQKLPTLKIKDLEIYPPIIQGGMGVRVSTSSLAAAVANEGGVGVIASVGLGAYKEVFGSPSVKKINEEGLRNEIRKAKSLTKGIIGINAMTVLTDYENLVKIAVEENVDVIISGAGLPLELPKYVGEKNIKLIPIVSSARALKIICGKWSRNFNRLPDAVIVEGPQAGGHLGFDRQELVDKTVTPLEQIVQEVLELANSYEPSIPVIPAGGVFDGKDIARFIRMGASGVQMGTRFVCTHECSVHDNFKKAYIEAEKEDLEIVMSPVGLPGRVIKNDYVEKIKNGQTSPVMCQYQCLKTCNPKTAPYCIARVLANAVDGEMEEGFVFAGSNAFRCHEVVSVKQLISQLTAEAEEAMRIDLGVCST